MDRLWVLVAIAAVAVAATPLPRAPAGSAERHVRIEASMRGFSPSVLEVSPGERVTLELVSTDVVHGLYLDGYGLSVTADPGQPASLTFVADRPGMFRFRCSVTCGSLHPFLVGKLHVGSNGLLWRAVGIALLVAAAALWRAWR